MDLTVTDTLLPYTTLFRSPVFTVATCSTVIGTPLRVAITVLANSPALRTSASERTARPSPLRLTKPPPTLVLLRSSALPRSVKVMPSEASFCTSGTTRNCLARSEEHTSELQSLMRISYAVFCLKKKKNINSGSQISHHSNENQRQNLSLCDPHISQI